MLVDINVLVAAARSDHAQRLIAQKWMSDFMSHPQAADSLFLVLPGVAGFIRLLTKPRVFKVPTTSTAVLAGIQKLLEYFKVGWLEKGHEWDSFQRLVGEKKLAGNNIPDGWLASLAISLSEPFVTFDKGFKQLLPRFLLVLLPSSSS